MAAVISLAGALGCVGVAAFSTPDALSLLWLLNFGVILCAIPYLAARYLIWRCPECNLRLEWFLTEGRCGACQAVLETPTTAPPPQ